MIPRRIAGRLAVALRVPGESGFRIAFLKTLSGDREVAYIRFAHMGGYRETLEERRPIHSKTVPPSRSPRSTRIASFRSSRATTTSAGRTSTASRSRGAPDPSAGRRF